MEVCYSGTFYPMCDEGWTNNDAAVLCYYYGYSSPYYRKQNYYPQLIAYLCYLSEIVIPHIM